MAADHGEPACCTFQYADATVEAVTDDPRPLPRDRGITSAEHQALGEVG